jgi:hypothetical protein
MKLRNTALFAFAVLATSVLIAQDPALSIDDESHYSLIFGNQFCRVYAISLDRLGETKPIAHERNWVWMSLAGRVTEALGGSTFQSVGEPVGHEEGYSVHFRYPVSSHALRNDHINPYQGVVVELMKADESRYRTGDPSLNAGASFASPGDTEKSYLTWLVKTNVEIDNLQLLGGAAQEVHAKSDGHLLVAMTDVDLRREVKDAKPMEIHLGRGEVKWIADAATATYTNAGKDAARFAILQMK